jgi:hypothetical protein
MQEPGFYRDGISALVAKLDECISGRGFGRNKDTLRQKKKSYIEDILYRVFKITYLKQTMFLGYLTL